MHIPRILAHVSAFLVTATVLEANTSCANTRALVGRETRDARAGLGSPEFLRLDILPRCAERRDHLSHIPSDIPALVRRAGETPAFVENIQKPPRQRPVEPSFPGLRDSRRPRSKTRKRPRLDIPGGSWSTPSPSPREPQVPPLLVPEPDSLSAPRGPENYPHPPPPSPRQLPEELNKPRTPEWPPPRRIMGPVRHQEPESPPPPQKIRQQGPGIQPPQPKRQRPRRRREGRLTPLEWDYDDGYDPKQDPHYVPLDPRRKNLPSESRNALIFHHVTPNPMKFEPFEDVKTGTQFFFRRISDGKDREPGLLRTKRKSVFAQNPAHMVAVSGNQESTYNKLNPGKWEQLNTTGGIGTSPSKDSKPDQLTGVICTEYTEWYKITPKKPSALASGSSEEPWKIQDLGLNLIKQHHNFKNHKAGVKDSAYASHDAEMRAKCVVEPCRIQLDEEGKFTGRYQRKKTIFGDQEGPNSVIQDQWGRIVSEQ